MREEFQAWLNLRQQAMERLRETYKEQADLGQRLLQAIVLPEFHTPESIELLSWRRPQAHRSPYALRHMVWRTDADSFKLEPLELIKQKQRGGPLPTLDVVLYEASAHAAEDLIKQAKQISVPSWPETNGVVLDGVGYELAFGDTHPFARFCWNESIQEEWQPLTDLVNRLREVLRQTKSENT